MNTSSYIKLQKEFGGKWVSTSKGGQKVYAAAKTLDKMLELLKRKNIPRQKTVIGYVEKYGRVNIYLSL